MTRDECANCGKPEKEHSYNGACYGECGEFVPPSRMTRDEYCANCKHGLRWTKSTLLCKAQGRHIGASTTMAEAPEVPNNHHCHMWEKIDDPR